MANEAKNQNRQAAQSTDPAPVPTTTVETAPVSTSRVPFGKRISIDRLAKIGFSRDGKVRYVGAITYELSGAPGYRIHGVQVAIRTLDSGRHQVEIMMPGGRFTNSPAPISPETREAQEAHASWLRQEASSAAEWLKSLPDVREILMAQPGGSAGPSADLAL